MKKHIRRLWTGEFIYWWIISAATVLMFDIFWMLQTTFRPMSYFTFYPVWFLQAFLLALPSLFSKNGVIQTIWILLFDALFIANLMYCRTYYNAIPLNSYMLAGNLADFMASVADSVRWYFVFLPVVAVGAFVWYTLDRRIEKKLQRPLPYLIAIIVLGVAVLASDAGRGGVMNRMEFMSNYAYLSSSVTPIYSLGGYLAHDYYKSQEKLSPENAALVENWLQHHDALIAPYWQSEERKERKVPKNLVIILCESLESWVMEKSVEGKEITPNINAWLKDTTTFFAPNVLTQVGSGRSIEGQLLILTGLMPMNNKVYAYNAIDNVFFSLPKAMKETGASTIELTPDKPYVWNQARVAPAFGFEMLVSASDFDVNETTGTTRRLSDGQLMKQVVEKLGAGGLWKENEKVMIMTVTNSGHNPFDLPKRLRTIDFEGDFPKIIKDYMVTAHYTDTSIKTFIDYLKSRPDWEETMVVITSDHEGLASDRKIALENPVTSEFVDPGQHTPLIILNSPVAGRFERELRQVDIYTTLLDLMALYNYPWRGLGMSIFDPAFQGVDDIEAKNVSDLILKFNLLKDYPDSISCK